MSDPIAVLTQDLFEKLNAIPALAGKVGLTVGGKDKDPSLAKVALPVAWPIFLGMKPVSASPSSLPPRTQALRCRFGATLFIPYTTQADLLAAQYPILTAAYQAIQGTQGPSGMRWEFEEAQVIQINPDRLGYQLVYAITSNL